MSVRRPDGLAEEHRTKSIIGGFYKSYNTLGFGFRESVYVAALERELVARGHSVAREVQLRVYYESEPIAWQRIDMLVDDAVIVETKAGFQLHPTAIPQLDNYLKATTIEVGLLLYYGPKPEFYRRFFSNLRSADP
jgi:GxxExxY protein